MGSSRRFQQPADNLRSCASRHSPRWVPGARTDRSCSPGSTHPGSIACPTPAANRNASSSPDSIAERGELDMAAVPAGRPPIPLSRQLGSRNGSSRAASRVARLEGNPIGWAASRLAWSTSRPATCCMGETERFSPSPSMSATHAFTANRVSSPRTFTIFSDRASRCSQHRKMAPSPTRRPSPSRLAWFGRDGKEAGQLGEPAIVQGIRISPDGTNVAMDSRDNRVGSSDIWVSDVGRRTSTRLHSDSVDEILPFWSADGSKVIYRSDRHGPPDVWEIAVGHPGSEKPLLELPAVQQPEDVSRDGRRLAYLNETATTVWNIFLLPLGGDSKPMPWLPSRFSQTSPRFSPDGRWIAYESDESGAPEIYVALTEGGGQKRRISPSGGRWPRWREDGKELYYYGADGFIIGVCRDTRRPMELRHSCSSLPGRPGSPDLRRDAKWVALPGGSADRQSTRVAAAGHPELDGGAERRKVRRV